jgi:hypothetical protein
MITIVSVLICENIDLFGEILSYFSRRIIVVFRYSEKTDIAAVVTCRQENNEELLLQWSYLNAAPTHGKKYART